MMRITMSLPSREQRQQIASSYLEKFGPLPEGLAKFAVDTGQYEGLYQGMQDALERDKGLTDAEWNRYVEPPRRRSKAIVREEYREVFADVETDVSGAQGRTGAGGSLDSSGLGALRDAIAQAFQGDRLGAKVQFRQAGPIPAREAGTQAGEIGNADQRRDRSLTKTNARDR